MTGARKLQGGLMSNDNCNYDSGSIIGTVFSILILAAIWPYLLAMLGLYIAYMVAVAVLEWMAQHLWVVASILLGVCSIYLSLHYRLLPKAWAWLRQQLKPKAVAVTLSQDEDAPTEIDLEQRKFIPSTNQYCYWCTKKLGIKAWERDDKYYCDECNTKQAASL